MKVNIDLNRSNPENVITDELKSNVGSAAFTLEHDFFFIGNDFEIWTGPGKTGTQLVHGSDYAFTGRSSELSSRANGDIYQYVVIFTGSYQTGDLYFNYHACADWIEADDRYSVVRHDGQYLRLLDSGNVEINSDTGTVKVSASSPGLISIESNSSDIGLTTITSGSITLNSASDISFNDQYQTSAIGLSETGNDGLSNNFSYDSQTDFNWTVRNTSSPVSLLSAINSNRDDIYEYVELLSTKGAAVGVAAGANLVGCSGISSITPTGKTLGSNSNLQEMLEGVVAASTKLPIGTILMYDGAGWVDNDTIPGWYACIAANVGVGCPDLENKFIMGAASAGATGGSNTWAAADLPTHSHSIDHDHPATNSGTVSSGHTHSFSVYQFGGSTLYIRTLGDTTPWSSYSTGGISANHTHSTNLPNYTGLSGDTGDNASADNRPAYYSVIYIRKCS